MIRRDNLPRVTYTTISVDFGLLHDMLDEAIPAFKRELGKHWPNLIAGRPDEEGAPYAIASPLDSRVVLGQFVAANPPAVQRAVAAARAALPAWSGLSWQERVAALRHVAETIEGRKYDLAIASLLEVGKSRLEAVGEAEEAVALIQYYCDEMERNDGFVRALARPGPEEETRSLLRPIGVFGVIAPFNFPVALAVNMMSGVLLGGNTVVFKPGPASALTGSLLTRCFVDGGLPDGVVNMLCGEEAGAALTDAAVDGIVFTGSHAIGMKILRKLAAGPTARAVIAEMGGKNPAYVTRSADLDVAAEGIVRSAFGMQGQKCSACSVAYVDEGVKDAFLERVLARTEALAIGNTEERRISTGPVVDEAAGVRYAKAVRASRRAGRILIGGRRLRGGIYDHGCYLAPTVVSGLRAAHRLAHDELFVPLLVVHGFGRLEEAIRQGNSVRYGLTAGFYGRDPAELRLFLNTAEAGVLYANRRSGATTGAWPGIQSFGGWKGSTTTGKGGLGPHYLPQFMREQSQTTWRDAAS